MDIDNPIFMENESGNLVPIPEQTRKRIPNTAKKTATIVKKHGRNYKINRIASQVYNYIFIL